MLFYIALSLVIFSSTFVSTKSDSCDCHQVNDWNDLRTLIMRRTNVNKKDVQEALPLCPFSIGKNHDEDTHHWSEIIYISSPIHIYCKKESPSDFCAVTITGDECELNENCGRQLFKIMSGELRSNNVLEKVSNDITQIPLPTINFLTLCVFLDTR